LFTFLGILALPRLLPSLFLPDTRRNTLEVGRVFLLLHEVRDIQESVPLESQIDERRLHPWEHTGNAAFINGAGEGVFVLALVINLCELFVLENGQTRFMGRTGNTNFF
jgi:hypothetical protein